MNGSQSNGSLGKLRVEVRVVESEIRSGESQSKKTEKMEPWAFESVDCDTIGERPQSYNITVNIPRSTYKDAKPRFKKGDLVCFYIKPDKWFSGTAQLKAVDCHMIEEDGSAIE